MESLNNSTETIAVREILKNNSVPAEILVVVRITVGVLVLLVNGGIALAFLIQKIRRPNAVTLSPAGLLVVNLLLADALVGLVTIVNITTFTTTMVQWPYWCSIRLGVSYLALIGSHIALINVAIDRYVAIMYTLRYRDFMTTKRSWTMLCLGWVIPLSGLVGAVASNSWVPGLTRCASISSFKIFLIYLWIPSHILALLCVIMIQCRVYLQLRRHERENAATNLILRRFSQKSARILFRVTTTFVLCWCPLDVSLVLMVVWLSPVVKTVYDVTLVFAQLSFLVNPVIYSYQTANIRRPVSDLFKDIRKWLWPEVTSSQERNQRPSIDASIIRTISSFRKSMSTSSVLTRSTSATSVSYI